MNGKHRVHWYRQHTFGSVRWRCDLCGDEESDVFAAGWNMALRAVLTPDLLEKLRNGESIDDEVGAAGGAKQDEAPVEADAKA